MKNFKISTIGFLSLLLLNSGCKDDNVVPDYSSPSGNIVAFNCKATYGGHNQIEWTNRSQIGLFCDQIGATNAKVGLAAASAGTTEGYFYTKSKWGKGQHTFNLYYPYIEGVKTTLISGMLNDVQQQISDKLTHVSEASLMYAQVVSEEVTQDLQVDMECAFGYINYSLTSPAKYSGWKIKSVTLSNEVDFPLAGTYQFDITNGKLTFTAPQTALTIKVSNAALLTDSEPFEAYVVASPGEYSGKKFNLAVEIQKDGEDDKKLIGTIDMTSNIAAGEMKNIAVNLDQLKSEDVEDLSIDLSAQATANCYVAGVAGQEYRFNATVMGNGAVTPATAEYAGAGSANGITPTVLNPVSAELLWQTAPMLVSDVKLKNGYVYFTLNGSSSVPLTEGNAVIAIYDQADAKGNILWSWHIWVTSADLNANVQTYKIHDDYVSYTNYQNPAMMDRNLGALTVGRWAELQNNRSHGLRYQWGRKDPIVNSDDTAITETKYATTFDKNGDQIPAMATSADLTTELKWASVNGKTIPVADIAKYPMNVVYNTTASPNRNWLSENVDDLWGNSFSAVSSNEIGKKSIYDPCPPGYRVPHPYVWSGFSKSASGGKVTTVVPNISSGVYADDHIKKGGLIIKYDGASTTTYPVTGFVALVAGSPLQRIGTNAGSYWSSMPGSSADVANFFWFDSANFNTPKTNPRAYGYSVRCMRE